VVSITAPDNVPLYLHADISASPISPVLERPDYVESPMPILAGEVVRFAGEPIAVVLGRSQAEAEDFAELVEVDINPDKPVLDMDVAIDPTTRAVHFDSAGHERNTVVDSRLTTDDFDKHMAECDHKTTIEVISSRQSAVPIETRGSFVEHDLRNGKSTLTTSTQMPHVVRTGICDVLGLQARDLRVIAPDVGGAFGAKMALAREDVVLVSLSRKLKASIAWIETRSESFLSSWHSREQVYRLEGGFKHGRLHALRADLRADVGAYSCYPVTYGVEPLMAMAELPGPYDFAHYSVRARGIITNKCPIAPYRGVSRPVQTLAMECLMDTAAKEMSIDRLELRRHNLIKDFPHKSPTGLTYDEGSYVESLADAAAMVDVEDFRRRQLEARQQGRLIGLGMSVFSERTGYGTPAFAARGMSVTPGFENVDMTMDPSGGVTVRIGASPHGQGLSTTLAQVIADRLGLQPSDVAVISGDTDETPFGWGSFASRSMVISGGACQLAADDLAEQIREVAGMMLECSPRDIILTDGKATVIGSNVHVVIRDIARTAYLESHRLATRTPGLQARGSYDPAGTFSNACHMVEVEVDPETGHVEILRYLVVEDAGVLVNPAIVDGQVHGGVAQGVANALLEELVYDDQGTLLTTSFLDYLPPTAAEIPHIEIAHRSSISDATLTGAKGVGEGGTIGAPAAILGAISDALDHLGIRVVQMPATPSRIRELIRNAQEDV
jgi:carbon-monoxide dehydrogenase large subunit